MISPSGNPGKRLDRVDLLLIGALALAGASYAAANWRQGPEGGPAQGVPRVFSAVASKLNFSGEAAVPTPAAPPSILKEQEWGEMTGELARLSTRYSGRVAIYLRDLRSGKTWSYHESDLFPSASLIKVPIMVCVFYRIQEGKMSLSDKLALRRPLRRGGSGSLKWQPDGSRFTVWELVGRMINESDNTATAMLLDSMGLGYVQQQFPRMGLVYTGIYEEGMSIRGGKVAHENYTTAQEMTMLLEKIYRGELVDRNSSQLMLDFLRRKKAIASRLAKGLPLGWSIAHKTGLLRQACHDSAIFLTPNGDYALTVLTGQNASYKIAKDFITRLGRITFKHYNGEKRYYAKAVRRAWPYGKGPGAAR
ncbi:MAG: serine hydrolase [Elusimicrobia bacterium]|nr:serine hydrolase [Elusimicrobiota bacterium]